MTAAMLAPRHSTNMTGVTAVKTHFGYSDQTFPCTSTPEDCLYLDLVYRSHDDSLLYSGIMWAAIGGILLLWAIGRHFARSQPSGVQLPTELGEGVPQSRSAIGRLQRAITSHARSYLLPDAARPVFGRVTRTQVLTLTVLTGYLIVFSFVGLIYRSWIAPAKKYPGVTNPPGMTQTRTTLGPWSDRIGVFAYALTPLSVMLASRESILSLVTGLPYQSFNFLHRWLGYVIFLQSAFHTIAWCIVETRLYQPQPYVWQNIIKQEYIIWGVVAMVLLLLMVVLSTPWGIRLTGYEFFRKAHYVLAMVYIGAIWGHWAQLKVFLLPGLIVWFIDRGIRFVRTALLHYNFLPSGHMGFRSASATVTLYKDEASGDVVRLDFDHPHDAWAVGQHFYLTFPESSIWQSHPFTPVSRPAFGADNQRHSYIFRAKSGETKKIADLSVKRIAHKDHEDSHEGLLAEARVSVLMTGPYGERTTSNLDPNANVICIAGGTGITYVLPVLLELASRPQNPERHMTLVWAVRRRSDIDWVAPELAILKRKCRNLRTSMHIYVTRAGEETDVAPPALSEKPGATACDKEIDPASSSESSSQKADSALSVHGVSRSDLGLNHVQARPDLDAIVRDFVAGTVRGGTDVFASGPGGMISDLRRIVASANKGGDVWKGNERWDVRLTCDDRLEW
jgi:predicted ferric reductase